MMRELRLERFVRLAVLTVTLIIIPLNWFMRKWPTPSVPMLTGQTRDIGHEMNFQSELIDNLMFTLLLEGLILALLSAIAMAFFRSRRTRWIFGAGLLVGLIAAGWGFSYCTGARR